MHTIGYLAITGDHREALAGHVILRAKRGPSIGRPRIGHEPVEVEVTRETDDTIHLRLERELAGSMGSSEIQRWAAAAREIAEAKGFDATVTGVAGSLASFQPFAVEAWFYTLADHADEVIDRWPDRERQHTEPHLSDVADGFVRYAETVRAWTAAQPDPRTAGVTLTPRDPFRIGGI